jgi:hypothetical protein
MSEILFNCRGFDLRGGHVPQFELRRGAVITLQLPTHFEQVGELSARLCGDTPRSEIEIQGRCVVASRAQPPYGWRRWFSDPFPSQWLVRHGFASDEALAILARHSIDDRHRLSRHAATPRTLLGLEAAYRSGPDFIIFNTSGLDPFGELAVQNLVRTNLHRTAAIYFATPYIADGVQHLRNMSGSVVIEIAPGPVVTV